MRWFSMFSCLLVLGAPATAVRAADLTPAEARCQAVLGPQTDLLGARHAACLARCDRKAQAGKGAAADCVAPYAGPTAACVAAAGARALRKITAACASDCPECYAGADCATFGAGAIGATGVVVQGLANDIFCDGAGTGSVAHLRCRAAAAQALAKAATATGRCVVACVARQRRGTVPAGSCTADPIVEARTAACIAGVARRAGPRLTRGCTDPAACLQPTLPTLVARVQQQILLDYRSFILCGSPGGAFF
jgi:hypothetical protein